MTRDRLHKTKRHLKLILISAMGMLSTWSFGRNAVGVENKSNPEAESKYDDPIIFQSSFLNSDSDNKFAAHRSHSSHRSHRSSSGGGGRVAPTPSVPSAPPITPVQPTPTAPPPRYYPSQPKRSVPQKKAPLQGELTFLIMRVQLLLAKNGYDPGAIDGQLGPKMREALKKFQKDKGISQTGTLTTETLNALGVKL